MVIHTSHRPTGTKAPRFYADIIETAGWSMQGSYERPGCIAEAQPKTISITDRITASHHLCTIPKLLHRL